MKCKAARKEIPSKWYLAVLHARSYITASLLSENPEHLAEKQK